MSSRIYPKSEAGRPEIPRRVGDPHLVSPLGGAEHLTCPCAVGPVRLRGVVDVVAAHHVLMVGMGRIRRCHIAQPATAANGQPQNGCHDSAPDNINAAHSTPQSSRSSPGEDRSAVSSHTHGSSDRACGQSQAFPFGVQVEILARPVLAHRVVRGSALRCGHLHVAQADPPLSMPAVPACSQSTSVGHGLRTPPDPGRFSADPTRGSRCSQPGRAGSKAASWQSVTPRGRCWPAIAPRPHDRSNLLDHVFRDTFPVTAFAEGALKLRRC
jgi:hypothetical protein